MRERNYEYYVERLSDSSSREELLGVTITMLFSKKVFPRNLDIQQFLGEAFALEFKDYVFRSRTIIASKISRYIINCDSTEIERKIVKSISWLRLALDKNDNFGNENDVVKGVAKKEQSLSSKKNKKDIDMQGWLTGLSRNKK